MSTANILEKIDRRIRDLSHAIIERRDTPAYDIRDVELLEDLEAAAKRIRILEATIEADRAKWKRTSPGFSHPVSWR